MNPFNLGARTGLLAGPCLLGIALLAGPSAADTVAPPDTAVIEIEGASVMGARPGATRGGGSVVRAEIDSLPIPAAATLRDVLEKLPTVHVRTNSRGEAEISLRGSESRQVSVLYDGLPLTLSWDGRTDVSVIPVGAMQQVSLVPGLASLLSGPNVLGGVIDFQSGVAARHAAHPSAQLSASVDETGGFGTSAAVTVPRAVRGGVLTMRAGLGHRDSPGAPLASGVRQPIADEDLRINTDAVSTDAFASLRYDHEGRTWISLSSSAFREERGIAAELESSAPRYWRYPNIERSLTVLSTGTGAQLAPWGGVMNVQASFGADLGRTEIDAFDSIRYGTRVSEEDGEQSTLTMRVSGKQTLGRNADLRLAVTSGQLTYDETLRPGSTNRYRHRMWSAGGETVVRRPIGGGGALSEIDFGAGLAYDRSTNPLAGDKPGIEPLDELGGRAGVSALFAGGKLTAHANVNRRARFPSLRELYSGALNRFTPNPDLKPEKLLAGEMGVTIRDSKGSLQVVGFSQRLDDAVVRIRVSGRFQRVNQEGLRSRGVELVASRRFGSLAMSGNFTAQSSDLLDPSAALDHPENLPELMGGLRAELSLPRGFVAGTSARYTGEQFALHPDTGELQSLPAGTAFDVDLERSWRIGPDDRWASTLRAVISADNLTDELLLDAHGLPGPGRLIRVELKLQ